MHRLYCVIIYTHTTVRVNILKRAWQHIPLAPQLHSPHMLQTWYPEMYPDTYPGRHLGKTCHGPAKQRKSTRCRPLSGSQRPSCSAMTRKAIWKDWDIGMLHRPRTSATHRLRGFTMNRASALWLRCQHEQTRHAGRIATMGLYRAWQRSFGIAASSVIAQTAASKHTK